MTLDINQPLNPVFRRRAAFKTLTKVLSGPQLYKAMWMIEDRDQTADRLTFLGMVGVTAELFGLDNQTVSKIYLHLNKVLQMQEAQLPLDPYQEMLDFRSQKQSTQTPQSTVTAGSSSIFHAHDILGSVNQELDTAMAFKIGQAVASEAKSHQCETMILGNDSANTNQAMLQSVADGIRSTGVNVIDLGTVPISVLNFVSYHFQGRGGIMISGSDTDDCNGIKIVVAGEKLEGEKILQIQQRIDIEDFATDTQGAFEQNNSYINEYIGMICEDIQIANPRKVVVDCSIGPAGKHAVQLLRALDVDVIECTLETLDTSEITQHIKTTIAHQQADLGFIFDNEGGRFRAFDNLGNTITSDKQIMILAQKLLTEHPTSQIIHDTQSNSQLSGFISQCAGIPVVCKSGSATMKNELKINNAKMAGDMHGHIYFYDRWFGFDDAHYAVARLLEALSTEEGPSSDIFNALPESLCNKTISIPLANHEQENIIEALSKAADFSAEIHANIDVLRIDFEAGWVLIRLSPNLSDLIIYIAATQQSAIQTIEEQISPLLKKIIPNVSLS